MTTQEAPNRIPWPPILVVAGILASVLLAWILPLPWIPAPLSDILFAVGWLVAVGAVVLEVRAVMTLRKAGTTVRPDRGSQHLVTSGPYALTRNPIYLGNAMLMIGVALISGIAWFILLGMIAAFATQKLAIEREEQHLSIHFGKKYRDYAKRVRRWI